MSANRYLLLDFDGVVNATSSRRHRKIWPDSTTIALDGFEICYSPGFVARLERLATSGVHIHWLTTWQAKTKLFAALGFSVHPWFGAKEYEVATGAGWWKAVAAEAFLSNLPENSVVAWLDDDLATGLRNVDGVAALVGRSGVLPISPDPTVGVTPAQLRSAEEFFGLG